MISGTGVNIKQSFCRGYITPGVYLSFGKQLTTAPRFFGNIYDFILVCKTLVQKRLCCLKSKKTETYRYNC